MSFSQGVLHGVLQSKEEKCSNITTQCTKETCISRKNHGKVKENKLPARNKIALELLHQRLGHISTISLLAGDNANVWEDVDLRIYPDPFCTSCQISSMNKNSRSETPLKPKAPFKWVFMDIIPSTTPKILTSDTTFSNYILIIDAYSKIEKTLWYGENHNRRSYGQIGYVSVQIW